MPRVFRRRGEATTTIRFGFRERGARPKAFIVLVSDRWIDVKPWHKGRRRRGGQPFY